MAGLMARLVGPDVGVWVFLWLPLAAFGAYRLNEARSTQRADARRRAVVQAWAAARGWEFEREDIVLAMRWSGAPFQDKGTGLATNVVKGELAGRELVAFDYRYDGPHTDDYRKLRFHVTAMKLPAPLPYIGLTLEDGASAVARAFGERDIEFESEDFNRVWYVMGGDPRRTYDVVNPRVMELLLRDDARVPLRFDEGYLLCWVPYLADPVWIDARLAMLRDLLDLVPDFVWQDAGGPTKPKPKPRPKPGAGSKATATSGSGRGRRRRRRRGRRRGRR